MAFLDNFLNKFMQAQGPDEENEYTKLLSERDKLKQNIRENLKRMDFTSSEVNEVFSIINVCYDQLEAEKAKLYDVPVDRAFDYKRKEVKAEVSKLTRSMLTSLKLKVSEIRTRKGLE